MINPQKKSKRAIVSLIMAMVMVLTCLTTACQPTPEEPIVIGKGDGLSDLIQSTPDASIGSSPGSTSTQTTDALFTKLEAQKHWSLKTTALGDKLNITTDVDIELPSVSQLPAATASLSEFTQEDLDKIADVLGVGNAEWTERIYMTKEHIEQCIIEDMACLAEYEAEGDDKMVERMEENIKSYKQMYIDAPYQSELINIEFIIGEISSAEDLETGDNQTVIGFDGITQVDGQPFSFYACSDVNGDSVKRVYASFDNVFFGGVDIDAPYGVSLTKAQATEQADEIAKQLTNELRLCYITPAATNNETSRNWGWACVFMREINGCPTAYETTAVGHSLEAVNVPVNYEKMIIVMDDEGMVSFTWDNPMTIESIDNTDVSLLSFDKISQRATEQIAQRFADIVSEDIRSDGINWGDPGCTAKIAKAELGLMRVGKANGPDYYYIPVWKFFVDLEHTDEYYERTGIENSMDDDYDVDEKNPSNINYEYSLGYDVVTINAIDGSVVDSDLGY